MAMARPTAALDAFQTAMRWPSVDSMQKLRGTECPLNTCCSQYGFVSYPVAKHTSALSNILNHPSVVPRKTFAGVRSYSHGHLPICWIILTCNRGMPEQLCSEPEPARWWLFNRNPPEQGHRILRIVECSIELPQSCSDRFAVGCAYTVSTPSLLRPTFNAVAYESTA